jgi:hypothetical protein
MPETCNPEAGKKAGQTEPSRSNCIAPRSISTQDGNLRMQKKKKTKTKKKKKKKNLHKHRQH